MRKYTRRDLLVAGGAAGAVATLGVGSARAQAWPNRPVTLICPWGAGGGTDATARIVAAVLEKELKQPFNVVNRTGGSGVVGHAAIATRRAGRLHDRHHHRRDLDDALAGADRVQARQLHAARADERGPARHPGQRLEPVQDRQGAGRRHQGGAAGQAESVRHRPGRHLASGAGRLAHRHGPEARSRRLGAARTALRPPCRIWPPAGSISSPARCRKPAR